ncbi:hypothetical protein FBQ82_16055 [Anaerolineae bacterium CFX7]|nr:hypothetical protein [Anaerolineae bacterium CFX7]
MIIKNWMREQKIIRYSILFASIILVLGVYDTAHAWQATFTPFYHTQSFCGTVDAGGQEDAEVLYEGGARHVYAEGAYLRWTANGIGCLQYAMYQLQPAAAGAIVFHAFGKNSTNCNNLRWINGWAWTNLPGASISNEDNGCQLRFYIMSPNGLTANSTYYAQLAFNDNAYPTAKTRGEVTESTYFVQLTVPVIPIYRDDNAKLCIRKNVAALPTGGLC